MVKYRTNILILAFLVLAGILIAFSFFIQLMENEAPVATEQETQSYASSHIHTYKIGDSVTLSSEEDAEGDNYSWTADFGWTGTMEVKLEKVSIYKQDQFKKLNNKYLVEDDLERQLGRLPSGCNPAILCYQLTLHSIDAEPLAEDETASKSFDINSFILDGDVDFASSEPIYLQGTYYGTKKYDGKNGYSFNLKKGESTSITIGYVVGDEAKNADLSLKFGTAEIDKYAVKISASEIKEVD